VRLAYWNGQPNFGDLLSKWILDKHYDIDAYHTHWAKAQQVMAGSILQQVPANWTGVVCGTGSITTGMNLAPAADVRAVRGVESARATGRSQLVLGDPGILVSLVLHEQFLSKERSRADGDVFIPHYADGRQFDPAGNQAHLVVHDVTRTISTIVSSKRVVSSSLHVLIVADALGIEHLWSPSSAVLGEGFKFRDYASAFDAELRPNTWRLTPRSAMQERIEELDACVRATF